MADAKSIGQIKRFRGMIFYKWSRTLFDPSENSISYAELSFITLQTTQKKSLSSDNLNISGSKMR